MNRRMVLVMAAACFAGVMSLVAADLNMGSWKLNEAKSKFEPGAPKNRMVVVEAAGDNVKVTVDGVDGSGKAIHNEWTGKFDGKDYPVTGDSNADARSYTRVDDHTMSLSQKKGGKVVTSGRIVIAQDGKSRTVTVTTEAQGKKSTSTAVYDKQ